jgi:cathepsin L
MQPIPKTVSASSGIDWEHLGYTTPVRDQGDCGCCWIFSSSASIESALMIRNKADQPWLSVQQALDCAIPSAGYPDLGGCDGGLIEDGLRFGKKIGYVIDDAYPYELEQQTCSTPLSPRTKISDFWDGVETTEQNIIKQLAYGPVAAGVAVKMSAWGPYKRGVLTKCASGDVNHGILIVGYGHDDATGYDYFKIKNSWGDSWGENGYVRLMRNGQGFCSITDQSYRPMV